ncbi:hypothetical protein ACPV54_09655 [Vibrio mediterranei]
MRKLSKEKEYTDVYFECLCCCKGKQVCLFCGCKRGTGNEY